MGLTSSLFPTRFADQKFKSKYARQTGGAGGTPDLPIPKQVGNPIAWFDPSDESTVTVVSTRVTALADKGQGSGLVVNGSGPVYGTALINSLKVLDFDEMGTLEGAYNVSANTEFSVYDVMVSDVANDGTFRVAVSEWTSPDVRRWVMGKTNVGAFYGASGAGANVFSSTLATTAKIITFEFDDTASAGTQLQYAINNVNAGQAGDAMEAGSPNLTLGGVDGTPTWNGKVGEVIIYDSILTTEGNTLLYNYLASKWGIS